MKHIKKVLAMMLVLVMVFATVSFNVSAEELNVAPEAQSEIQEANDSEEEVKTEEETPIEEQTLEVGSEEVLAAAATTKSLDDIYVTSSVSKTLDSSTFKTIVSLDAGRKYFSVANIETIIDEMSAKGYNTLELILGNDGLRFLLDDMSVTVDNTTYTSDQVTSAIKTGNTNYSDQTNYGAAANELSQSDMDTILEYAKSKNISIIPAINTPGHMDSILYAATQLTEVTCAYASSGRTIDVTNATAVEFTQALVTKYIEYFAKNGCAAFNMGADEYANDTTNGFSDLISNKKYSYFVKYVNSIAAIIKNNGMVPIAFNDGIYYNGNTSDGEFDSDIAIAYWTNGWSGYSPASSAFLAAKGHQIINTNSNWYYVLGSTGSTTGWATWEHANQDTKNVSVTTTLDDSSSYTPVGSMLAIWCDTPSVQYSTTEQTHVLTLIDNQATATANADYFTKKTDTEVTVTDDTTGITVKAKDLTGVTVTKTEETTDPTTNQKTVKYDITPTTASGNYEGSATVTIPVPSDWNQDATTISVYDAKNGETVASSLSSDNTTLSFTASHFSEYDLLYTPSGSSEEYTSEESVTVSAGATKVVTTTGANNAGAYTTADTSVATVAVTGSDEVAPTTSYNSASNVKASSIATKTSWTKTNYYYKASDGEYYPVYAYYNTSGSWWSSTTTYYWGYSTTDSSSNVTSINSTTSSNNKVSGLYTKTGTDGSAATTTITFTGVAEGTTSVIIGGVKYNITVTGEDLSGVSDQIIHLYCSTFTVWAKGDSTEATTVSISASDAYGKDGIDISTKVPAEGSWAYSSSEASTVFWKGVKLTYANRQSATSSADRSMSGVNYSKIRYYGGKWSVYDDDNEVWVDIASDDEVDAYYLQKTEVTSEVTTYVKDWAYTTSNCSSQSGESYQKALSFAVVYPDGQMSPATEDDIYAKSTLIYWQSTQNMFIRVGVNEVYEVEKLTYTAGERASTASGNWSSSDSINWNKKTTADGSTWYDETTAWTPEDGSDPVINCADIDAFSYSKGNYSGNDAILVLIYLKAVTTEDSLTVKYVDDTNNTEFVDYSVNVTNTSTEAKGTFLNRLIQTSKVQSGEFTLDDNAYVTNAKGTNETFQKDLTKIPSLMGTSYASGLYNYVKAEISEDGKTLTLHYNLKSDITSTDYVIDFGLATNIPISDLTGSATYKSVTLGGAFYGDVAVDGKNIVYTPKTVLKGYDVFNVHIEYSNETVTKVIKVYPATTVYYEEGFATASDFTGGSKGSGTQQTQKLGAKSTATTASTISNYGYDAAYASNSGASSGTQATSIAANASMTFNFKGTGVDVYANCTSGTGRAYVQVLKGSSIVKLAMVNTVTNGIYGIGDQNQYDLPVFSISGLTNDEYTVKVTAIAADVNIDGFKVYNTIADTGSTASPYKDDYEDIPSFYELRNELLFADGTTTSTSYPQVLGDSSTDVTAVAIDGDTTSTLNIQTDGPKNEIFLKPNATLTFKVNTGRDLQVGLKAVNDATSCTINGDSLALNTTTDMFYNVTKDSGVTEQTVTIKNTGTAVLSITKLKVCDDPNFAFLPLTNEDLTDAYVALGLIETPAVETADAVETLNLVDCNGDVIASTDLTANGAVGETAVFAADEIKEYAESILPEGYAFVDESAIADASVAFGESSSTDVQIGKIATLNITYKKGRNKSTVTLTKVQTSSDQKCKFSASEIKKAAPAGYRPVVLWGTNVKYGSSTNINVICF